MEKNKELTLQQKQLYGFLEQRGDKWTSRKDIALELYVKTKEDFDNFKGDNNCPIIRQITKDVQTIRKNAETNKLIISGVSGYKIANPTEVKAWLNKLEAASRSKWALYHNSVDKAVRNGQYRLTNGLNKILCTATTEVAE